jgi:hypothetical protein
MIKSRMKRWTGNVAQVESRGIHVLLVGEPSGKRRLGDQDVGEWIILRGILATWDGVVWTSLVWFKIVKWRAL